ncbi:MAG: Ser/Thr phosphatase family protein, partial [Intestinibacter bartlettii DORA_8_9]
MGRLEDYYYENTITMRTLLLMRGAPASGKSQWIRDNNL